MGTQAPAIAEEERMRRDVGGLEAGFSLVEMLVALTITLIISGAMFGLLSGGQSAFRREPELTDRQQNARIAMNLIVKDVANAGIGMPAFVQTFTRSLNAPTGAPTNSENVGTDEIEILANDTSKDNEAVCNNPGNGNSVNLTLVRGDAEIPPDTPVMLLFDDGTWTFRNVVNNSTNSSGAGSCTNGGGARHVQLNVNSGVDTSGMNTPSGVCKPSGNGLGNAGAPTDCVTYNSVTTCGVSNNGCPNYGPVAGTPCCTVTSVSFGEIIHYRIRNDTSGVPVLERRSTADAAGGWRVVATGIEDLQVQYSQASAPATWIDSAPAVVANNFGTLINQVRVTVVARSEARNIQGATTSTSGKTNIRGSLTSVVAPRATLVNLANDTSAGRQWW
jgi:type IV pilus assembly protein PilW